MSMCMYEYARVCFDSSALYTIKFKYKESMCMNEQTAKKVLKGLNAPKKDTILQK